MHSEAAMDTVRRAALWIKDGTDGLVSLVEQYLVALNGSFTMSGWNVSS